MFAADTVHFQNQKTWNFTAIGKTRKAYDLFYTVRDTFMSYVSYPNFEPLWFQRSVNHGKSHSLHHYEFFKEQSRIQSRTIRGNDIVFSGYIDYHPDVLDLLSTAYSFRNYNFDLLDEGQKVSFSILIDNKIEKLFFRYLGEDEVKSREGRKFRCHKVSVWLVEGDFFPEGEHLKIWFTKDKNHLPVMVETEILVGKVKAIIMDAEGLKYSLDSEIID